MSINSDQKEQILSEKRQIIKAFEKAGSYYKVGQELYEKGIDIFLDDNAGKSIARQILFSHCFYEVVNVLAGTDKNKNRERIEKCIENAKSLADFKESFSKNFTDLASKDEILKIIAKHFSDKIEKNNSPSWENLRKDVSQNFKKLWKEIKDLVDNKKQNVAWFYTNSSNIFKRHKCLPNSVGILHMVDALQLHSPHPHQVANNIKSLSPFSKARHYNKGTRIETDDDWFSAIKNINQFILSHLQNKYIITKGLENCKFSDELEGSTVDEIIALLLNESSSDAYVVDMYSQVLKMDVRRNPLKYLNDILKFKSIKEPTYIYNLLFGLLLSFNTPPEVAEEFRKTLTASNIKRLSILYFGANALLPETVEDFVKQLKKKYSDNAQRGITHADWQNIVQFGLWTLRQYRHRNYSDDFIEPYLFRSWHDVYQMLMILFRECLVKKELQLNDRNIIEHTFGIIHQLIYLSEKSVSQKQCSCLYTNASDNLCTALETLVIFCVQQQNEVLLCKMVHVLEKLLNESECKEIWTVLGWSCVILMLKMPDWTKKNLNKIFPENEAKFKVAFMAYIDKRVYFASYDNVVSDILKSKFKFALEKKLFSEMDLCKIHIVFDRYCDCYPNWKNTFANESVNERVFRQFKCTSSNICVIDVGAVRKETAPFKCPFLVSDLFRVW